MEIINGILQYVSENDIKDGQFTIPDSVTTIGVNSFHNCVSLASITIPDSVTTIEAHAFSDCISLTSITIPDSVTSIEGFAFYGCTSLVSIMIPKSVTNIGYCAFRNCTSLTSITIPDSVTSIGLEAFAYCSGLLKKGKFKATNKYMRCMSFQYELGKPCHEDEAILCKRGFHYCTNAFDVLNYYYGEIGKDVRFFRVKTSGTSRTKYVDSKRVCTDITLMEEIKSYKDLLN